jgi:hypothetical protein
MKKLMVVMGFLGGVTFLGSMVANADPNCPSGNYYRMSGRCADPPKAAAIQHPAKSKPPVQKKPQTN